MVDLEGNELEAGTIYILPGNSSAEMVVCKYSHETMHSYVFKDVSNPNLNLSGIHLYTWKRVIPKWGNTNGILAYRASQALIDKYGLV